jgi:peroxiredoxin
LGELEQKGLAYSQAYKDVKDGMTRLGHDYHDYIINYIQSHRSLVSFCMLARECLVLYDYARSPEDEYNYKTLSELFDIYETDFADRFPGHPFHDKIAQLQENATMLAGQSHYVDFTLPDADGVSHSLSELIDGKIAVLDLWASWCGGCRRHSKALIPLYDKYKDRGFTIVGVARELKDDLAWRAALEKDGYPWVNLLAMEPDHWVWSKYGVGNGGGGIFLIGRDGIVVAVNPTVEEIEEYVKKSLDK